MNIINAKLRTTPGSYTVSCKGDHIGAISLQPGTVPAQNGDIDAQGQLLIAPFVEPHIHLDAALTAGQPEWNLSGTLFEGIERWAQRKETITHEDTKQRAHTTLRMLAEHGIQHVRTHVDVTDPTLAALRAMIEVRVETRHLIDLQIVAFPQEGIESYAGGRELMTLAVELGADVVGGIPHFENTREQGVSSIKFLMDLAERTGCLVDVHCDETDDPHSRFLEVLAEEARVRGMGSRVTDNSARTLDLGERYGIAVGRPANMLVLDAESDYEAVRRKAKARLSIRGGKVLMTRVPERGEFS